MIIPKLYLSDGSLNAADSSRSRQSVRHSPGQREWARNDDRDGVREVIPTRAFGFWTGLGNFLRRFRGVSKHYLQEYVCVYAWLHNFERRIPQLAVFLLRPFIS
jgi:transposase